MFEAIRYNLSGISGDGLTNNTCGLLPNHAYYLNYINANVLDGGLGRRAPPVRTTRTPAASSSRPTSGAPLRTMPAAPCKRRARRSSRTRARAAFGLGGRHVAEVRDHLAHQFHGHRHAVAIAGAALGDANPRLADAVFLDVVALDALEADADAALERALVVNLLLGLLARRSGGVSVMGMSSSAGEGTLLVRLTSRRRRPSSPPRRARSR
jgi:hypothetical protein